VSTFRFCPRCGSQLSIDSAQPFAPQKCFCCGSTHYHGSKPCAGALIVEGNLVLLSERAIDPFKGDWDVPGGFLEAGEDPKEGARREVLEETGLEVELEGPFAVLVDRYPYGKELDYTLNLYYLARIISGTPRPADDVASLRWFPIDSPPERIAFAHCRELLERLKQSRG
jgi:ADP-ribose pyrophosphatase YjhB (NUDIX family)